MNGFDELLAGMNLPGRSTSGVWSKRYSMLASRGVRVAAKFVVKDEGSEIKITAFWDWSGLKPRVWSWFTRALAADSSILVVEPASSVYNANVWGCYESRFRKA